MTKIRIVNAQRTTYWYANKIGEVFDATPESDGYYVEDCRDGTGDPGNVDVCDCEVVSEGAEDLANITVLTDEYGLQREYTGVKRKAAVGERIKITDDDCPQYTAGKVYVAKPDTVGSGYIRVDSYNGGTVYVTPDEYVVLVPTDIVRIGDASAPEGNVRYRLEQRKANVGDRVVVTFARRYCFKVGEVYEVRAIDNSWGYDAYSVVGGAEYLLRKDDSRVITPVDAPIEAPPLSTLTPEQQRDEIIANLAQRMAEAEARLTALEALNRPVTSAEIAEGIAKLAGGERKAVYTEMPTGTKRMTDEQWVQALRDETVERAKADVEKLQRTYRYRNVPTLDGGCMSFYPEGNSGGHIVTDEVAFVIDRDKRTVVALIRWAISKRVWAKGIAKCAPDDVFNVHIGKAIALRLALGLEIPDEYVNAPKPTEVRVGDIVESKSTSGEKFSYRVDTIDVDKLLGVLNGFSGFAYKDAGDRHGAPCTNPYVIDDSREDVTV